MIEIIGKLRNAVDCGCYEVEALPTPEPRRDLDDCACPEDRDPREPEEVTDRVKVDAKDRSFRIPVDDAKLRKWFPNRRTRRFRFRAYLNGEIKVQTTQGVVWTNRKPPQEIPVDVCPPEAPPPCGKVCGRITDCRGKPLKGMQVRIFDVDLSHVGSAGSGVARARLAAVGRLVPRSFGRLLGETLTNECGEYCLCYRYPDYSPREIDTADIRVVVGTPEGQAFRTVRVSEIHFNVPPSLTVDLRVPGSELDDIGEFLEYHGELKKLGCITPDARKNLTQDQIDFISNEAGIPREHLLLLKEAYGIDREFFAPLGAFPDHIFAQILYGLLRMGVTGPYPSWAMRYVGSDWTEERLGDKLAALLTEAINDCVIARNLSLRPPVSISGAGFVIWLISFVYALRVPLLPSRSSWKELFAVVWSDPLLSVVLFRFGFVWLKHGIGQPMWDELATLLPGGIDINDVRKLVQRAEISGFYKPAVQRFYAGSDADAAFEAAVASDEAWEDYFRESTALPAPDGGAFADYSVEVRERARAHLGSEGVANWVAGVNADDFPDGLGLSDEEANRSAVRLSRLTTSADFARRLAEKGFTSARDIAALRWEDFATKMEDGGVQALYVYTKARETRAVTVASTLQLSPVLNAPMGELPVPFMRAPVAGVAAELLGGGSSCDCEGRQSVFSPAAYLHALRRFLANIPGAIGEFDARRPEIGDLQLSYVNSYTALPTIDLNNEVLEALAARLLSLAAETSRQTTLEAAELELKWEGEDERVYGAFTTLDRPWRFPFDLNHTKRRILLDALPLAREEIQRLVLPVPSASALAEAVLDMNSSQRGILDDPALRVSDAYGTDVDLSFVPTMLEKAQIDFQDLYAITQLTHIYRETGAPVISPEVRGGGTPCDPSAYSFSVTGEQADQIHRFVRLWRALPWPMHLLDWAILVLPPDAEETRFPLTNLGLAELIRKRLKLKPHEVIAFWARLSTLQWHMPFVNTKAIRSPWEQVFRLPFEHPEFTVAFAARSCGVAPQFVPELASELDETGFDPDIASRFFRYGRLSRAVPGVRPEDIKRYGDLRGEGVFDSPERTWSALEDFEAIRRSGARLSAVLPFYRPQTDPKIDLQRREFLAALEDINRRAWLPQAPFETVLARFVPEATVRTVADTLARYGSADAAPAQLDSSLAELLALPSLLAPTALSSISTAQERNDRVLDELSRQRRDQELGGLLSRLSGLDRDSARLVAEAARTSYDSSALDELSALQGDGGIWPSELSPDAPEKFLDEGVIDVPPELAGAELTFSGEILVGPPGEYQVRVKAWYSEPGEQVAVGSNRLAAGAVEEIDLFTVAQSGPATHLLSFKVVADVGCTLTLELVEPSGDARPLPGTRLYSTSREALGATEALELMSLSGALAAQWKLDATDLSALARLAREDGSGLPRFPRFPPQGDSVTARPLAIDAHDGPGFRAWLEYARLVAALKMTRGEGRRILYETALLAQSEAADEAVWAGIAAALDIERKCVEDAARKLDQRRADFGKGVAWLKLFDLSRALQQHGVSADSFAAWGAPDVDAEDLAALEAAVRGRLAESRSGAEKLRGAVDRIRVLKRDALADYVLAHAALGWLTRKDISDHLLTDIEMEPCAQTSRVRFAIAAVQRLVTQILAQSEPLRLNAEQEREWQSIFQYRLWEVRQKILLYPENWLRFGRHLHRSDEFEELQRSLLQGDLTDEKAQEALTHYVEQLHGIGHLEIVGTCSQQELDATGAVSLDLLHVIGRTPAEPRAYYHRTRVDGAYWTPWKKIELDIDCDQIVPVVHNRQLHLFWLVPDTASQTKPDIKKDERQVALEDKHDTLRLAWSVRTSKGWRAKMISKDSLSTRFGHYAINRSAALGTANVYAEVHAWNQAVQDIGHYQLRSTLSREGDAVIEVYARLESMVVSKIEEAIPDWVHDHRRLLQRFAGNSAASSWYGQVLAGSAGARNGFANELAAAISESLPRARPAMPAVTPSGTRRAETADLYLVGMFRLTPDNLVEVRYRSAATGASPLLLTAAERARTAAVIAGAVSRSGAFEFDDGSVELYAGGAFRTVLASAGTPVRVVVTRQEIVPSQRDPVFCRIKNRTFFAFKQRDPLPAVSMPNRKAPMLGREVFHAAPAEYVDRARSEPAPWGRGQAPVLPYGVALADKFAASIANAQTASSGTGWRFSLAHHPQTIELLRGMRAGLDRFYRRETQNDSRTATGSLTIPFSFAADYTPVPPWVDTTAMPQDELEFRADQAFAVPNWEVLYHAPVTIAAQLMTVGRFEDARRWTARVFNPRDAEVLDPAFGPPPHPEKYWVFKPFSDFVSGDGLDDFQHLNPDGSGDRYLRDVFRALIKQWRANPFNPHAVAAFRPQAYQLAAVFLYVELMIAFGDSLFAMPSAELVEEAARRYEEAERVIGRPPLSTGAIRHDERAFTLSDLDGGAASGSADLENALSIGDGPSPNVEDAFLPDLGIGYFCLPPNPKIKELRDRIQDRLFKAHHCLDLLGNPRKLPLYDPPIDPALLADAAMAGLNISQAVMDAYTPRPHYRFRTLVGLAKGFAQHVVSLGGGLLSAMEKRDAESLAALKATHEAKLLERATAIRKLQLEDAEAGIKALEATLKSVEFRREFYESREFMNAEENTQITLSLQSTIFRVIGQALNAAASSAGAFPDITIGVAGSMASPVTITKTGGENFARVPAGLGLAMSAVGDFMGTLSSIVGSMGSFRRRKDDWDFQAKAAELEAKQIHAQTLSAKIRKTIAEKELANHEAQLEESREALDFVRTKQTAVRLYEWLVADIGASYYRAFQLAHSMALQAQRALQEELGSNQRHIGYSHWDGSHSGLQAGERLMHELLAMEAHYHGQNARPVPKTIDVSLVEVDPIALARLKVDGTCRFHLNEEFWDRHAPGLYFRRFATVAISVPAVVGPVSGVHGRLSIERASYRKTPTLLAADSDSDAESYLRVSEGEDSRFVDQFPRPGDFIVLSTGTRDTGLGADEQREDRYRPFESLGVASDWRLDISQKDNAFDLSTISDVMLHVEYTARDGGELLMKAARAALAARTGSEGFVLSLRHQYAAEWHKFKAGETVSLDLTPLFPKRGTTREGRPLASLEVAVLLRAKDQPPAGTTAKVQLTPPFPLAEPEESEILFDEFDFAFELADHGGARFALASNPLPDSSLSGLSYEELRSPPWGMRFVAASGISSSDLEDAVLSFQWILDAS